MKDDRLIESKPNMRIKQVYCIFKSLECYWPITLPLNIINIISDNCVRVSN